MQKITTEKEWTDIRLSPATAQQVNDIAAWMQDSNPQLRSRSAEDTANKGFLALFTGPSGTGKTLTATLLGKKFQKEVHRIDLSEVVSKYIGETEKNLDKIFTAAEQKDWILFFDEADAIFGKRTEVKDAHDKYANQEIAYLLQRIEEYKGLVIIASNQKANTDEPFTRRCNAVLRF